MIYLANIKHTQENICKTHMAQQPPRKKFKNSTEFVIQICPFCTKLQIPWNIYKTAPQKLREGQICEMPKKLNEKQATDQRAQNALLV